MLFLKRWGLISASSRINNLFRNRFCFGGFCRESTPIFIDNSNIHFIGLLVVQYNYFVQINDVIFSA
jgi:hypothetical protein